jgi:hypothetical protein
MTWLYMMLLEQWKRKLLIMGTSGCHCQWWHGVSGGAQVLFAVLHDYMPHLTFPYHRLHIADSMLS